MTVLYNIYTTKQPPDTPEGLSAELRDFLQCCLKLEPTERLNVYQLLRHPFITGDIIVNNKQEISNNCSYDLNKFASHGIFYNANYNKNQLNSFNKLNNFTSSKIINLNENNILSNNFSSGSSANSEANNKHIKSEIAMK